MDASLLDPYAYDLPLVRPSEVEAYIPQKYPFALIDTLYRCEPELAVAGLHVRPDNLLVQRGHLSEGGIIESMAQAVALKSGYEARRQATGSAPRVGFIAALKDVQIGSLVPVGRNLLTRVEILLQALDVIVVRTTSSFDRTQAASCEMRLFLEKGPEPDDRPAAAPDSATAHYR